MRAARLVALLVLALSAIFLTLGPRAHHRSALTLEVAASDPVVEWVQPAWTLPAYEDGDPTPTTAAPVATTAPPAPPSTVPTTEAPAATTAPPGPAEVAGPEPEPTPVTPEPEPATTTTEATVEAVPEAEAPPASHLGGGWEAMRQCESGGNYATHTGNGYSGAYQFDQTTWDGAVARMGRADLVGTRPASASPGDQDAAAVQLYSERGAQPWPVCGRYL